MSHFNSNYNIMSTPGNARRRGRKLMRICFLTTEPLSGLSPLLATARALQAGGHQVEVIGTAGPPAKTPVSPSNTPYETEIVSGIAVTLVHAAGVLDDLTAIRMFTPSVHGALEKSLCVD